MVSILYSVFICLKVNILCVFLINPRGNTGKAKIWILDQTRVNGGNNFEY